MIALFFSDIDTEQRNSVFLIEHGRDALVDGAPEIVGNGEKYFFFGVTRVA
jgi:hypothetical protein